MSEKKAKQRRRASPRKKAKGRALKPHEEQIMSRRLRKFEALTQEAGVAFAEMKEAEALITGGDPSLAVDLATMRVVVRAQQEKPPAEKDDGQNEEE